MLATFPHEKGRVRGPNDDRPMKSWYGYDPCSAEPGGRSGVVPTNRYAGESVGGLCRVLTVLSEVGRTEHISSVEVVIGG